MSVLDQPKRFYTLTVTEHRRLIKVSKTGVKDRQVKVNAVWKRVARRVGGFYTATVVRGYRRGRTFWAVPRKAGL